MDNTYRKIIHIDMDAFFASVEQLDNPALRGRPVAVGHSEGRSVVAAASYEARRFGVRSAMPSSRARQLCPQLIFVEGHFERYKEISARMHAIFHDYTDIIEPISLDEAFLDVTRCKRPMTYAVDVAREIKARIRSELGLVASAGVSYNKFLAKIASDFRKPDGLCTIHPSRALDFIAAIPIEDFWGVGPVTARKMHSLGIATGADLREWPLAMLVREFGRVGAAYYDFARGIDNREVEAVRVRKSVGCEVTLDTDLTATADILEVVSDLAFDLNRRRSKAGFRGTTLTLKIKFDDFTQITRSHSVEAPIESLDEIVGVANYIVAQLGRLPRPVRLLGLSLGNRVDLTRREDEADGATASGGLVEPSGQLLLDFGDDGFGAGK